MRSAGHRRIIAASIAAMLLMGCGNSSPPTKTTTTKTATPEAVEAALSAVDEYLRTNDLDKAETILAELARKAPRDARVREAWGQVLYLRAGQTGGSAGDPALLTKAYEHYRAATELDPESAGLQHSAALMALAAGRNEQATAHLRNAAALEPGNVQHALHLAQLLIQAGDLDEAEAELDRAAALDRDEPFVIASLAIVAAERGDINAALERMEQARVIDPANVVLRVQESKLRRRVGQGRAALELLVGLTDAQRAEEAATFEIAAAWTMLGEPTKAAGAWEHRLRGHPGDWMAALHAAECWLDAGDRARAKVLYEAAEAVAPPRTPEVRELGERIAG